MKEYILRIVDSVLQNKLEYMGTVLIEGCKWWGAMRYGNSINSW